MKTHCTIAVLALFVLAGCGPADAPSIEASAANTTPEAAPAGPAGEMGALTHNDFTMEVKSVVVVWDEESGQLSFELLPFEPTAEEIERCRSGETFFMTVERTDGAGLDAEQFPDRVPFASYQVQWMNGVAGRNEPDFWSLHAHFIAGIGTNLSLSYPRDMQPFTLEGTISEGETVALISNGEEGVGDDSFRWNLNLQGTVYTAM